MFKSKNTLNESEIYVSDYMSGKLEGIPSVSTNCLCNERCKARHEVDGTVCRFCYAGPTEKRYTKLNEHTTDNLHILSERVLDYDEYPKFLRGREVRIESFGDTANVIHALNYLRMIQVSPNTPFGWWTKNMDFYAEARREIKEKPANLSLIQSSLFLNIEEEPKHEDVDGVFTVFTPEFLKEHPEVKTNCDGRACLRECGAICYHANEYHKNTGKILILHEIKK